MSTCTTSLARANAVTRTFLALGTIVSFHLPAAGPDDPVLAAAVEEALRWIAAVERSCSRFDPEGELAALARRPRQWVGVSNLLAGALDTALRLARVTEGAFDPAVGAVLAVSDPSRDCFLRPARAPNSAPKGASYRDIELDLDRARVRLRHPVLLDLGAVAKGLAVDLAARAFASLGPCLVEAGGDLHVSGEPAPGRRWRIGIAGGPDHLLGTYSPEHDRAVCTSGAWSRPLEGGGHHLLDARTMRSATSASSATVIATSAMVADAAATAAYILGPEDGTALLRELDLDGLVQATDGTLALTSAWLTPADRRITTSNRPIPV